MAFTAEQLIERRKFLGASECSAALGMSTFFTPLELYQSKKGLGEPIETTIPMMVGAALEPVAIELFERESKMKVFDRQKVVVDPNCPWRRASLDGRADDGGLVEAKTSGDYRGWGKQDDEIPLPYLYNAMHSLACVPDAKTVYFPVLIGGRVYRMYEVKRDEELIDLVRMGEDAFWNSHVMRNVPPPPTNVDDLKIMYPRDKGGIKIASADDAKMVATLAAVKKSIKILEEEEKKVAFAVKALIGDNSTLQSADGTALATFTTTDKKEFVTKATSFRTLRLK